ncbi:MAG: NTP transferase domain-containing protein [Prevotella sp.]|nr:NTP transferase domain-containing protein [Prevotella sp.]
MNAMIFAAGRGTRLKPLTDILPKALVPVGDKPLLQHVLDRMAALPAFHPQRQDSRVSEAEESRVVVNVHHFGNQIINFLRLAQPHYPFSISISDERHQLLETGGAIKKARSMFVKGQPVLIHNCDILSNADLAALYASAAETSESNRVGATLLVSDRKTTRYLLFDKDMRLVGWTNIQTGEVKSPHHDIRQRIDRGELTMYAFSGIHVISQALFPLMDEEPDAFPIIDFYLKHCATFTIRGVLQPNLRLLDVGKLDTLGTAADFLQS